jgi:hypothetical protein
VPNSQLNSRLLHKRPPKKCPHAPIGVQVTPRERYQRCGALQVISGRWREVQPANPHKHTSTLAHFYPQQLFLYHTGHLSVHISPRSSSDAHQRHARLPAAAASFEPHVPPRTHGPGEAAPVAVSLKVLSSNSGDIGACRCSAYLESKVNF